MHTGGSNFYGFGFLQINCGFSWSRFCAWQNRRQICYKDLLILVTAFLVISYLFSSSLEGSIKLERKCWFLCVLSTRARKGKTPFFSIKNLKVFYRVFIEDKKCYETQYGKGFQKTVKKTENFLGEESTVPLTWLQQKNSVIKPSRFEGILRCKHPLFWAIFLKSWIRSE